MRVIEFGGLMDFDELTKQRSGALVRFGLNNNDMTVFMDHMIESMEELKGKDFNYIKVDVNMNTQFASIFEMKGIPHFRTFKDGSPVGALDGGARPWEIKDMIGRIVRL